METRKTARQGVPGVRGGAVDRGVAVRKGKAVKASAFGPLYRSYIKRLKELGAVFCPRCYAYLNPHEHQENEHGERS